MNRIYKLCCAGLLLVFITTPALAAKTVNIGMVTDGPMEMSGWSPQLFIDELLALTKGEFVLRFPKAKQINGDWSAQRIKAALTKLQHDPTVDMVLALGYVAGPLAALGEPLRKPTFAPLVMDAGLLGLPRKGNTSGVKNLNYLSEKAEFVRDLESFRNVVPFNNLAVLVEETSFHALPGLVERARRVAQSAGITLYFVLQTEKTQDLAAKIPQDTQAVILTSVPRLSRDAVQRLIAALIEKRLPSYSLMGSHLVEQGVLMSESPASDWPRLARRNALNMQAVLRGESAGEQPVTFEGKRRLTINMATARAIGVSPRIDVLSEATLLHEVPEPQGQVLSLPSVARKAVTVNLELRAAAFGLQAGETVVDEARAKLLPQFIADLNYEQNNDDNVAVTSGQLAEQSTQASLTLRQIIYSDAAHANLEIQRYFQDNLEAGYRQLELDIIQEATTIYLNVLKAQTFVRIRKDDLQLTRANLELAADRQRLGAASPAEVYRWESRLANSRQELLAARAQLEQANDALNRILNQPLKARFTTEPAGLNDPALLISRQELFDYVNNDRNYQLLGEFLLREGLSASPELASVQAQILATERELKLNRRAYWSPTIALQGQVYNVLDENREAGPSSEGDTNWVAGVVVSLPLYEGGARPARTSGSKHKLDQQYTTQDSIKERIEQAIRVNLHRIRASYPSIALSRSGATAARKNFELVADAYSRGAVSILDLLDAQNAALIAEQTASNAVYNFLIDLMNLQRTTGRFEFFLDQREQDAWFERLKTYIATQGRG
jgi:outer membrane protein TolC